MNMVNVRVRLIKKLALGADSWQGQFQFFCFDVSPYRRQSYKYGVCRKIGKPFKRCDWTICHS